MEEDEIEDHQEHVDHQALPLGKCVCDDSVPAPTTPSEKGVIPARKQYMLSTVARTENYLREYRIPELIRYFLAMILAHLPESPIVFLEKLLDDCMLFRAGHGVAPVLYEKRHLEAVIKSFDPGQRGWLSAGQVQRLYATLEFTGEELSEERTSCNVLLDNLKRTQEMELLQLLTVCVGVVNKN
ncbi:jg15397 [Pararge aegeria aegeria]|uniref:Jg15397 protein n=2 Tax=Pararge aegeria TaxID=116150 RepID=A0A8S4S5Z4_9NEOP|nr:jg15397 [Pararge aegeria aegeria]